MPTKIKEVQPPRGMARKLYRLPIKLFRLHLGWLLMGHFLLLTHIGRKSGLPRQTILEVLLHDKARDVYYVLAGWGEQSDWVKNNEKQPFAFPLRIPTATDYVERQSYLHPTHAISDLKRSMYNDAIESFLQSTGSTYARSHATCISS